MVPGYGGNYASRLNLMDAAGSLSIGDVPAPAGAMQPQSTDAPYQQDMNLGNVSKALSIAGFEPGGKYTNVNAKQRRGAGFWQNAAGMAGAIGGGGDQAASNQRAQRGYTTIGEDGAANQKRAMGMLGSAVGAIANFYSGNWPGAAASASGLAGGGRGMGK